MTMRQFHTKAMAAQLPGDFEALTAGRQHIADSILRQLRCHALHRFGEPARHLTFFIRWSEDDQVYI